VCQQKPRKLAEFGLTVNDVVPSKKNGNGGSQPYV
jgi:hypothetical protein